MTETRVTYGVEPTTAQRLRHWATTASTLVQTDAAKDCVIEALDRLDHLESLLARSEANEGRLGQRVRELEAEQTKLEEEIQTCPAVLYHTR